MSEEDLLSQEEKDALIKGVESGDVDTETPEGDGEARAYNFASRDLRLLESLPRLQTVSELFTVAATEAIAKMFFSNLHSITLKTWTARELEHSVRAISLLSLYGN